MTWKAPLKRYVKSIQLYVIFIKADFTFEAQHSSPPITIGIARTINLHFILLQIGLTPELLIVGNDRNQHIQCYHKFQFSQG